MIFKPLVLLVTACVVFTILFVGLRRRYEANAANVSGSGVAFNQTTLGKTLDPHSNVPPLKVDFDFPYENKSDRPISIERIRSTCSCTVAQPKSLTINPRESSNLHVVMTVVTIGVSTQQVLIKFSDDPNPVVLECRADYEPDVYVSFSPDKPHIVAPARAEIQATVLSVARLDADVQALESSNANLIATVVKTESSPVRMAGGRWQTWITFHVVAKKGYHGNAELRVHFNDPAIPVAGLPILVD